MGGVVFNSTIDKNVNITENLLITKQVATNLNLDGWLATAEATADIVGAPLGTGSGGNNGGLTQLAFVIDGSGSISPGDFTMQVQGIADAIGDITAPAEITIIQFSDNAQVELSPVVINNGGLTGAELEADILGDVGSPGNADDLVDDITQLGGFTNLASGIDLATSQLTSSAEFATAMASLINVSTDGVANRPVDEATAATAATNSATAAQAAGIDGLSFEAVGNFDTSLLEAIAFPTPGVVIDDPNNLPDPMSQGFVLEIDDFSEFGSAVAAKVQEIFQDDGSSALTETLTGTQLDFDIGLLQSYSSSVSAVDMFSFG